MAYAPSLLKPIRDRLRASLGRGAPTRVNTRRVTAVGMAISRHFAASVDLRTAIAGLPPKERRAVEAIYLADLTRSDACVLLGISWSTLASHEVRALEHLAPYLDEAA